MARHSDGGKKSLGLRRLWNFSSCNVFLDRQIVEESKAKFKWAREIQELNVGRMLSVVLSLCRHQLARHSDEGKKPLGWEEDWRIWVVLLFSWLIENLERSKANEVKVSTRKSGTEMWRGIDFYVSFLCNQAAIEEAEKLCVMSFHSKAFSCEAFWAGEEHHH